MAERVGTRKGGFALSFQGRVWLFKRQRKSDHLLVYICSTTSAPGQSKCPGRLEAVDRDGRGARQTKAHWPTCSPDPVNVELRNFKRTVYHSLAADPNLRSREAYDDSAAGLSQAARDRLPAFAAMKGSLHAAKKPRLGPLTLEHIDLAPLPPQPQSLDHEAGAWPGFSDASQEAGTIKKRHAQSADLSLMIEAEQSTAVGFHESNSEGTRKSCGEPGLRNDLAPMTRQPSSLAHSHADSSEQEATPGEVSTIYAEGSSPTSAQTLSCPLCEKDVTGEELETHLRKELDYFPVRCSLCPAEFLDWPRAEAHFRGRFSRHRGLALRLTEERDWDKESRLEELLDQNADR